MAPTTTRNAGIVTALAIVSVAAIGLIGPQDLASAIVDGDAVHDPATAPKDSAQSGDSGVAVQSMDCVELDPVTVRPQDCV